MTWLLDFSYAWRLTRRAWAYSLLCAFVIALGVGLTLWTYSVAEGQMWRPLGFPGSDHWYSVESISHIGASASPSVDAYTFQELMKQKRSAEYLGSFESRPAILSEGQVSTTLRAAAITPKLFAAAQVPPLLGRILTDSDGGPQSVAVGILSYDTWQNYFSGDGGVVGKVARIDGSPVQIIGVMPKSFYQFQDFEYWLPLQTQPFLRPTDSSRTFSPIIALQPGQSVQALQAEMESTVEEVNRQFPNQFRPDRSVKLVPAVRMFTDDQTPILLTVCFMCGAVCLLGCVDIGTMLLARLLERSRELALRTALGATRTRLMWQCMLETAVILPLGLVGGYGLAAVVFRWGRGMYSFTAQILGGGRPPYVPQLEPVYMLIAALAAVGIWLLSTLIPAWRITKQDAAMVLAGSGKGTSMRGGGRAAGMLVGLQVLITCMVLVVCGNMVLGVRKELSKPTGLDTNDILVTTEATTFSPAYSQPIQRSHYWDDLSRAVESKLPGTQTVIATAIPTRPETVPVVIEGQGVEHQSSLKLPLASVSDNYFSTLDVKLRSGRLFDSTDNGESLQVAIIDERTADRYWQGQEVIGKRVRIKPLDNGPWLTIVGVASSVAGEPYSTDTGVIYRPIRQASPTSFFLLAKASDTGSDTRVAIRAAAYQVDRDLPLHNLQNLTDYFKATDLAYASLVPAFVAVGLMTALLAAAGLYGIISRSVAQRTQEVGIRRALGATNWRATSMFVRQGAAYLGIGMVGIVIGIGAATLLTSMVPNVLTHVAMVTVGVVALMSLVIFAASHFPSRIAVRMEPGDALRYQ